MCNVNTEFVANLKEKMNKILDEASESEGMDKTGRGGEWEQEISG